jgi:rRNA small subunit pseudouridine methyltransferase Nep1
MEPPKLPKTFHERETTRRVIVVLEGSTLEIAKLGKSKDAKYSLLNGDDHTSILKKHGKNPADYRPDITHQCLLTLLDSPLNRAGRLLVYIHTTKNVLVEVNPKTRIPRTYNRFAGLMVQLLHKLSVRSQGSNEKLLNIIKNPITDHLPVKCVRIGMSGDAGKAISVGALANELPNDQPVVFWVGAMAHGQDRFPDAERLVSCSEYPLSASVVCGKICSAFEEVLGIL